MTNAFATRAIAFILAAAVLAPSFAHPRPAHAQMAVIDAAVLGTLQTMAGREVAKEDIGDAIAWNMANMVVASIGQSIVNWINTGFEGSPAFVEDLTENLRGVADAVAAEFVGQLANQIADTPMRGVAEAVAYGYYLSTNGEDFLRRQAYTLRDQVQNDVAFVRQGRFNEGGWRGWFALTQVPGNNPYGSIVQAQRELDRRIEASLQKRITELGWGSGFLSLRGGSCSTNNVDSGVPSLGDVGGCQNGRILTPGSVIQRQLNDSLGLSQDRLLVADEVNEIIGALAAQLVSQALQGLSGVGSRSSGGSGYLDRVAGEARNATPPTGPAIPDGTPSTPGVDQLLLSGAEGQLSAFASYQQNWSKIADAADRARLCTDLSAQEEAVIAAAKTDADREFVRVSGALASLGDIVSALHDFRMRNPVIIRSGAALTEGAAEELATIARTFQALLASSAVPSSVEMEAAARAASANATPPSRLDELNAVAARCAPSS